MSARLFVAADLPPAVAAQLHDWAASTAAQEGVSHHALRAVARESLHVTLCFLGTTNEDLVPAITEALQPCAGPARGLETRRAAWLPNRSRARLAVVDLADPARELEVMQRHVAGAMARVAGHDPERRAFRPHVTLLRVRGGERFRGGELPAVPDLRFDAAALTLYRSHPGRGGSRYEPLARFAP